MNYTATGRLAVKKDTLQRTATFSVREFVIEISNDRGWTDFVQFQLTNNQCSLIDNFNVGDQITVTFDLRGRKWTNPQGQEVYFNTLSAWRIDHAQAAANAQPFNQAAPQPQAAPQAAQPQFTQPTVNPAPSAPEDDLPF